MMMVSSTVAALVGIGYYGFLGAFFLIIPKLWRPEVPFGVSVPCAGTEDIRRRALCYWNARVIALTAVMIVCAVVVAMFRPSILLIELLVIPFFAVGTLFYVRARKMLFPFRLPSRKVGVSLRPRHYRDYMSPWWEIVPVLFLIAGIVAYAALFSGDPHANLPYAKRLVLFAAVLFPGPFLYALFLVMSVLVARSKQSLGGGDPDICLAANEAFRKAWIWYFYAARVVGMANFALLACCIGLANAGHLKVVGLLPFVLVGLVGSIGLLIIGGFALSLLYGQGGWRWAVRKGLVTARQAGPLFDGDGMQDEGWLMGMFYFNPRDPSILVERRFGAGWTINFGSIWGLGVGVAMLTAFVFPALARLLVRD